MRRIVRAMLALAIAALALSTCRPWRAAAARLGRAPESSAGYSHPVLVTHAPGAGSVIFILEQRGIIRRATFEGGSWRKLGTFLDIRSLVRAGGEQGLLGLAFHPDYRQNGLFYVDYTRRGRAAAGVTRSWPSTSAPPTRGADPARRVGRPDGRPAGRQPQRRSPRLRSRRLPLHRPGGRRRSRRHRTARGQDRGTLLGKLLRIDPLDPDGSGPRRYAVPASQPAGRRAGRDEMWAWGLRNPWRFSFDRATRGPVDRRRRPGRPRGGRPLRRRPPDGRNAGRGANYGWSRCEGSRRYPATGSRLSVRDAARASTTRTAGPLLGDRRLRVPRSDAMRPGAGCTWPATTAGGSSSWTGGAVRLSRTTWHSLSLLRRGRRGPPLRHRRRRRHASTSCASAVLDPEAASGGGLARRASDGPSALLHAVVYVARYAILRP